MAVGSQVGDTNGAFKSRCSLSPAVVAPLPGVETGSVRRDPRTTPRAPFWRADATSSMGHNGSSARSSTTLKYSKPACGLASPESWDDQRISC